MEVDGGGGDVRWGVVGVRGGGEWDEGGLWREVFETEFAETRGGGGVDAGGGGDGFGGGWEF